MVFAKCLSALVSDGDKPELNMAGRSSLTSSLIASFTATPTKVRQPNIAGSSLRLPLPLSYDTIYNTLNRVSTCMRTNFIKKVVY